MNERAVAYIDLSRLVSNYQRVRSLTRARVICTVKADAYGHGAVRCVRALEAAGADFFCVATAKEALEIRRVSSADILLLGYAPPDYIRPLAENGVILSLFSPQYARHVHRSLCGLTARVHVAINSGMNRLGFSEEDERELLSVISSPSFDVCGAYSHLCCADMREDRYSLAQIAKFKDFLRFFDEKKVMTHISNSAGVQRYGAQGFDAVRVGMALYGHACVQSGFLPVMSLYARVLWIRRISAGEHVGYGAEFVAERDMKIATLAIGYADGLPRSYSGGSVLFDGCRGRLVGKICMDTCSVALPADAPVSVGEYGCIFDERGKNTASLSKISGLTPYEQLTAIGKRIYRIYKE
ncbi:MAG: alanine racemase [Clostridia bacterium]|nr:alanine racemase [Clostridia bacterium]